MLKKHEALEESLRMWEYLRDHPDESKSEYLLIRGVNIRPRNQCFICQYMGEQSKVLAPVCKGSCLIDWDGSGELRAYACETSDNSPFKQWSVARTSNLKDLSRLANEIVKLHEEAIARLCQ